MPTKIPLFLTAFKISSKYPLCLFWYGENKDSKPTIIFLSTADILYSKSPHYFHPLSESNNVPSFSQGTGAYKPWLTDQAIWVKSRHRKENKFDLTLLPLVCLSVKDPCGSLSIETLADLPSFIYQNLQPAINWYITSVTQEHTI